MIQIIFLLLVTVVYKIHGQLIPLIYAAPSAVSHQSRIDITHNPSFISTPFIFNTALFHKTNEKARDAILTPVLTEDMLFTPIALRFFHNLPLARALEHPISLDKIQEENTHNDLLVPKDMDSVKLYYGERYKNEAFRATESDRIGIKQILDDNNYVRIAQNNHNEVATDEPKMDDITK